MCLVDLWRLVSVLGITDYFISSVFKIDTCLAYDVRCFMVSMIFKPFFIWVSVFMFNSCVSFLKHLIWK